MAGKSRRDTSFVTATPSTVTSSSAAFGRWAFGIGQPRRDRRGRTGIVKGRSVRSGGNVLAALSCSASGICHRLRSYTTNYNAARTHLSLNKDAPSPRTVHPVGRILPTPFLGGLHHLYLRVCFATG